MNSQHLNFICEQLTALDADLSTIDQKTYNELLASLRDYFKLSLRQAQKIMIEALRSLYAKTDYNEKVS